MPIIINDDNTASVVDSSGSAKALSTRSSNFTPKFFHKNILTGKGGQSKGLLNESRDPKFYKNGYTNTVNVNMEYGTQHNGDIKIYNIPCFFFTPSVWDMIEEFDRPDIASMTKIATKNTPNGTDDIYLTMPIHALQIEEKTLTSTSASGYTSTSVSKDLSACFHMFLFSVKDPNSATHTVVNDLNYIGRSGNRFSRDIVHNVFASLRYVEATLTKNGYLVDKDAMNDFVQNYSIYTELCKAAEKWQTQADYFIADVLVKNINKRTNGQLSSEWDDPKWSVSDVLSRLEKYNLPLDQYQSMYDKMEQIVSPDILTIICKANLNLKLSNTLKHMNSNRANLQNCPCNVHVQGKIPYSAEQKAAIESTSPLTLVQSGAGTGKSTVILGRINHMIANGVDPHDITVLSFTNAAANHITDLQPNVHSMTIASMLHTIYSNNYNHQLSSLSTIINSLDIYYPATHVDRVFIKSFQRILERLRDNNEYTRANNFVEDNIDKVIEVLDTIQQTSLELESIICYQKMDTLVEPPETQTKHLIIDEVQDNSISEFVYCIKYTDKHCCSMYIVGDCSQTLYEFRASNPKALNVLENSGVFETHKLQTNYRSNQEILDFANVLLGNIEANQYANIQLRANSLKPVTLQSFKDAVSLSYVRMNNRSPSTLEGTFSHSISVETRAYIIDKLNKKEQICILAPTRRILSTVEKYLRSLYPDKTIASLVPKRPYDSALISKFIAQYWNTISYTPPTNIITTIRREIMSKIPNLSYKNAAALQRTTDIATRMLDDFENQYSATILNWQNQVLSSVMTQQEMLDEIQKLLIEFEIKRNAINQAVLSARNAEVKKAADIESADFLLSTIHSAKGLEFDNVIVYYEAESSIDEATKRMYYVAFTRARKTEFIFAFDTLAKPKIQGDYNKIIKDLAAKSATPVSSADIDDNSSHTIVIDSASNTPMPLPLSVLSGDDSTNAIPTAPIDPSMFAGIDSLSSPLPTTGQNPKDDMKNGTASESDAED